MRKLKLKKKRIIDLTEKEKKKICDAQDMGCYYCPLRFVGLDKRVCLKVEGDLLYDVMEFFKSEVKI